VFGIREAVQIFIESFIKNEGGTELSDELAKLGKKNEDVSVQNIAKAVMVMLNLLQEYEDKIYDPKEKDKATGQKKPVLLKKGRETFQLIERYLNHYRTILGGQNYDETGLVALSLITL